MKAALIPHALQDTRILLTHASGFMGPALREVFLEQGAEVIASDAALDSAEVVERVVAAAGRIDVLVVNLAFQAPTTAATEVGDD